MSINAEIKASFKVTDSLGKVHDLGLDVEDAATTVAGTKESIHDRTNSINTGDVKKIFDVTEDLANFDALAIISDQTVEIEFVVADGSKQVVFILTILANLPFILGSDNSRDSDHAENWATDGTADTIDKITVKNSSGATALVRIFLLT
jgi:hypothetical protein